MAANSGEGFVSYFTDCYDPLDNWKAYIIKGGPGTGKSSFMKYLTAKAADRGIEAELFPCSSDPDSLDAVIFPKLKLAVMDGTPPHTVEPEYPGVCERLLCFGDFWNSEALMKNSDEIIKLTAQNRTLHKIASRYIKTAGIIMSDSLKAAESYTDVAKAETFALGLCKKYIPKHKGGAGHEQKRFFGGITPKGIVSYTDTSTSALEKRIIISDRVGSTADIIFRRIRAYALENGYETVSVKNFLLPSSLYDGIIIPSLSLCFVREYDFQHFSDTERRIHARRFISAEKSAKSRERLRFNKKAVKELLLCACETLNRAKSVHDSLEAHYSSAMDFAALTRLAQNTAEELFGKRAEL